MTDIFLTQTLTTPAVTGRVDDGSLEIVGESYPENSDEFYQPIFQWLRDFMATQKRPIAVSFRMPYFSTSSSKRLLDILDILQSYHYTSGGAVTITWWYEENDEDMLESGKELCDGLDLKFIFASYSE